MVEAHSKEEQQFHNLCYPMHLFGLYPWKPTPTDENLFRTWLHIYSVRFSRSPGCTLWFLTLKTVSTVLPHHWVFFLPRRIHPRKISLLFRHAFAERWGYKVNGFVGTCVFHLHKNARLWSHPPWFEQMTLELLESLPHWYLKPSVKSVLVQMKCRPYLTVH